MRRSVVPFILVVSACLAAAPLAGAAASDPTPAPPPASSAPAQPQITPPAAPAGPPVYVKGQAEGSEVIPITDASDPGALLSVSWDGRRAALAQWAGDTNGDGAKDNRDYPTVSFFDAMTRRSSRLFSPSDRVLDVKWADPDRVLFLKGRTKASPKDARGDLLMRVIPTGREIPVCADVVWFDIAQGGQQALVWSVTSDTNGDGNLNRSDAPVVYLVDLRQAQPVPVRVLSGFTMLGSSFADNGFYYIARREDTNRDGRLDSQDNWRAYFYETASWESKPIGGNLRGSILRLDPSPRSGVLAMVERSTNLTTGVIEDSLYIRRADGGLVCIGSLGDQREILSLQWSPNGERCAVSYRQAGQLGINPVGVMIYASDAKLLRHYQAVPLSVSYPSFTWVPGGRGYIIERRTEEADEPRPTGKSQFLAAADLEPASVVYSFEEPSVALAWTGAGLLFNRYPEGAKSSPVALFSRYRFSGSLAVFEPLTKTAGGFALTVKPSAVTPRGIYLRVVASNGGDKENRFDPAKFVLTTLQGVEVAPLGDGDLAADLSARAVVDTLMQSYPVPARSTYAGYLAFQLPSDAVAQLKLCLLDADRAVTGEYLLECRSSLEIY